MAIPLLLAILALRVLLATLKATVRVATSRTSRQILGGAVKAGARQGFKVGSRVVADALADVSLEALAAGVRVGAASLLKKGVKAIVKKSTVGIQGKILNPIADNTERYVTKIAARHLPLKEAEALGRTAGDVSRIGGDAALGYVTTKAGLATYEFINDQLGVRGQEQEYADLVGGTVDTLQVDVAIQLVLDQANADEVEFATSFEETMWEVNPGRATGLREPDDISPAEEAEPPTTRQVGTDLDVRWERVPTPQSSAIRSIAYLAPQKTLRVTFKSNNRTYEYNDVPDDVWQGFKAAVSKGTYFAQNIRGRY